MSSQKKNSQTESRVQYGSWRLAGGARVLLPGVMLSALRVIFDICAINNSFFSPPQGPLLFLRTSR